MTIADTKVHVGYKLPNCAGVMCEPEWVRPDTILELAGLAGELRFDSVWLHDHLLTPRELQHHDEPAFYEPLILMATIAATVPDVIVGVATIIVPLRDPVLLAKQMVTLESFFPGRTIVGVGSGQYESEFEAFGSDGYHSRGKITDEYLTIMRELFTRDLASHAGAYRSIDGASFYPKPPVGAPPLWIGGNSPAAVRRAREFGSGWIMSQAVSPSDVALHLGAGEVSAGAAPLSAVLTATVAPGAADELVQEDAHRVHRHPSVVRGDPAEVAAGLSEYIAAGVTHLLLSFRADDVPSLQRHMRWFSEEVRPLLPPRRPAAEPRPGPAQKRSGG